MPEPLLKPTDPRSLLRTSIAIWFAASSASALYFASESKQSEMIEDAVFGFGFVGIMLVLPVAIGALTAPRVGLGTPLITHWVGGATRHMGFRYLREPILLGSALAVAAFLPETLGDTDWMFTSRLSWDDRIVSIASGFLGSLHAGVTEEVIFRFGMLSLVAWLAGFWLRSHIQSHEPGVGLMGRLDRWLSPQYPTLHPPPAVALQLAVVVSAVAFSLAHWGQVPDELGADVGMRTLHGIAFGAMYVRHGLEAAIFAHFSYDATIDVIFVVV